MEFMSLGLMIKYGTPVILLVLLIMTIVNTLTIRTVNKSLEGVRDGIVWDDEYKADIRTADAKRDALAARVDRIQDKLNGAS